MQQYHRLELLMNMEPGYRRGFHIDEHHLYLVQPDNVPYLFENRCPHLGYSFDAATVKATSVVCMAHAFEFDLRSGLLLKPEGLRCSALKIYTLEYRGNELGVYL